MNRIKEVLEEKGIKQIWLAEKLGKSYNMVNSYVQNRRQPSIEDLYKIADILQVQATDLLIKKIKVLKKIRSIDRIIINTDSENAIKIAKSYNLDFYRREKEFLYQSWQRHTRITCCTVYPRRHHHGEEQFLSLSTNNEELLHSRRSERRKRPRVTRVFC